MQNNNFFSFDSYEIEIQSVSYHTLPTSKSARKISGILLMFAAIVTLGSSIVSNQIELLEVFIIPLLAVVGWFSYRGYRVALMFGILLCSFVKIRLFFLEYRFFHLFSLGIYLYYLLKALAVENFRRKVSIKNDFVDFIVYIWPRSKINFFAGILTLSLVFGFAVSKLGDRFFDVQWNLSDSTLSSYKVRKDINLLKYTLENAYSGKYVLTKEFATLMGDLDTLLEDSSEGIEKSVFYEKLKEIFKKVPDGHLAISKNDSQEQQIRGPASTKDTDALKVEFTLNEFNAKHKKILSLTIPSFKTEDAKNVEVMLSQLKDKMKKSDILILDLRGNSGGTLSIPLKIGALLWGVEYENYRIIQTYPNPIQFASSIYNEVAYSLQLNWVKKNEKNFETQKNLVKGYDIKKMPEMKFRIDNYTEDETNTYEAFRPELKEKGFDKPIYILVDQYCASACERMIEALENHPNKIMIGQQTQGAVQFGSIGILTLPYSGVDVVVPTSYVKYKDGRNVERIGYKPDVVLSPEIDSFQVALERIEKTYSEK